MRGGRGILGVADGADDDDPFGPAATTEETFWVSIPPIANQGMVASLAAYSISPSPVPGRPSSCRRCRDGTDADLVGAVHAHGRAGRLDLPAGMGREPDQRLGAGELTRLGHGHVVLTDVDSVGSHRLRPGPAGR